MSPVLIVLAHEPDDEPGHDPDRARGRLRATLDTLWSEDPGITPARTIVHASTALAPLARREHGRRVEVQSIADSANEATALNAVVDGCRARWIVLVRSGVRVTPGWLRELEHAIDDGAMMVGPRYPAAADQPPAIVPPGRTARRQAATRLRFDEPRFAPATALNANCLGISRPGLRAIGQFDRRYTRLHASILDAQSRVHAHQGPLLVARRALVYAEPDPPLLLPDQHAINARRAFYASLRPDGPTIAIECEPDDLQHDRLIAVIDGLLERGLSVVTVSHRVPVDHRPSPAPHQAATTLDAATGGADVVLLRTPQPLSRPTVHLHLGSSPPPPDALHPPDPRAPGGAQHLDAWALELEAMARTARHPEVL